MKNWLRTLAIIAALSIILIGIMMFSRQYVRQSLRVEYDSVTQIATKYQLQENAFANDAELASDVIANHELPRAQWDDYFDAVMKDFGTDLQDGNDEGKEIVANVRETANTRSISPVNEEITLDAANVTDLGSPEFRREGKKAVSENKISGNASGTQKMIGGASDVALQLPEDGFKKIGKKLPSDKGDVVITAEGSSRLSLQNSRSRRFVLNGDKVKINRFYVSPPPSQDVVNDLNTLNNLEVVLDRNSYLRHQLIRANLITPQSIDVEDLNISLYYAGKPLKNFGYFNDSKFIYDQETIFATLFAGMRPPLGKYEVRVSSKVYVDWPGIKVPFTMNRREVKPIPKGFSVVNYESTTDVSVRRVMGVNGSMGNYENLLRWVKYMDNDAFWVLAAQTTGWGSKSSFDGPWVAQGLKNIKWLGEAARKNGIALGAYLMSFYTPKNGKNLFDYSASLGYDSATGELEDSYFISLSDERRVRDMTDVVKRLQQNEYVDYIGFDFIRTGRADGYENGPYIVRDMNISTPAGYENYTRREKIRWFASLVESRKDQSVLVKWRMWRAHRVASIVEQVMRDAGVTKPAWVFTLGWDHGYEHGQDPYMFFDAGITIDSVMLYEANYLQFKHMMVQWPNYMKDNLNNMMIGNATDIRFLDGNNRIDLEYQRRTSLGSAKVYGNGFAKGIFVHDLSRALWSKWGQLDVKEWAIVHGAATSQYRTQLGLIPYHGEIKITSPGNAEITVTNSWFNDIENVRLRPAGTASWQNISDDIPNKFTLEAGESKVFNVKFVGSKKVKNINLLGYYLDSSKYRRFFFYENASGQDANQTIQKPEKNVLEAAF